MTFVRTTLLCLFMLFAIGIGAVGIYNADAGSGHAVVDGYGVIPRD